tara:strand:- start:420 stop:524 length:105 start_codon:yes stop_codon:yes gene_type:complete
MEKIRDYFFAFLGALISPIILIIELFRKLFKNRK